MHMALIYKQPCTRSLTLTHTLTLNYQHVVAMETLLFLENAWGEMETERVHDEVEGRVTEQRRREQQ